MVKTRTALVNMAMTALAAMDLDSDHIIAENMARPSVSDTWCQFWFKPNIPTIFTLGEHGLDLVTGVLLANLHIPLDIGCSIGLNATNTFREVFVAGKRAIFEDREVHIQKCGANLGRVIDTWYRADITIYWTTYLTRGDL